MSWVIMTVVSAEFFVQRAIIVAKRIARQRIERAERLVHQHDAGLRGERARHADALALATGKLVRQPVAMGFVEPNQLEQLVDPRRDIRRRPTEKFWRDADIGGDVEMRKQRAALEDIADAAAQQHGIECADVLALDLDRATIGFDQPVGKPEQGGLARAGAADNGEELPLGDLKRDVVNGHHAAVVEGLADMRIGDQWRGRH